MASRAEQKQQAKAARLAYEADAARAAARHRNLMLLGAVLAAAIVVVIGAVAISHHGGSSGTGGTTAQKSALVARQFAGLPQTGSVVGDPKAEFTLIEFADLQCPVCQRYTLDVLPSVIRRYVRTGKIKMDFRLRTFIGPDSVKAAGVAAAAAQQSRIWPFADLFYHNQGEENSGYVTPSFLHSIDKAAGVDSTKADAFAASAASLAPIKQANAMGDQLGVQSTPTVFVGKRGGALRQVQAGPTDVAAFKQAIDGVLGQA